MSAKTDPERPLVDVLAGLFLSTPLQLDDNVSDGLAAACIEACRVAGLATMRQVGRILGNPSDTFLDVQTGNAVEHALDEAGLTAEECPRLAAVCAEEWRRAFLCH